MLETSGWNHGPGNCSEALVVELGALWKCRSLRAEKALESWEWSHRLRHSGSLGSQRHGLEAEEETCERGYGSESSAGTMRWNCLGWMLALAACKLWRWSCTSGPRLQQCRNCRGCAAHGGQQFGGHVRWGCSLGPPGGQSLPPDLGPLEVVTARILRWCLWSLRRPFCSDPMQGGRGHWLPVTGHSPGHCLLNLLPPQPGRGDMKAAVTKLSTRHT